MCVCMCVCVYVRVYVCVYVRVYVRVYVCVYVCTYVSNIYTYTTHTYEKDLSLILDTFGSSGEGREGR